MGTDGVQRHATRHEMRDGERGAVRGMRMIAARQADAPAFVEDFYALVDRAHPGGGEGRPGEMTGRAHGDVVEFLAQVDAQFSESVAVPEIADYSAEDGREGTITL